MSGEGPESIPTSADPRSKRPTKKRALTPVSEQAATVEALFAKPDQEIRIPDGTTRRGGRGAAAPPEIVTNVQGSSAGAGSGEFHVYKASRRRENERLRRMDEDLRRDVAQKAFEARTAELAARDAEKTRRNREKRDKKKKARAYAAANGGPVEKARPATAASANTGGAGATGSGAQGAAASANSNGNGASNLPMTDQPSTSSVLASEPSGLLIHEDDE